MKLRHFALLAGLISAPAWAGPLPIYPAATTPLTGAEAMIGTQGTGPNSTVNISASALKAYILANGALPQASSNAALSALASTVAPAVVRNGYAAAGDAPPLTYLASASACSLGSGAGDGGAQVPTSDSKCWIANFPGNGFDIREWGAKCDGVRIDTTEAQAAENYAALAATGSGKVIIPASQNGCVAAISVTNANNISIVGAVPTSKAGGGSKLIAPSLITSAVTIGSVGGFSMSNLLVEGHTCTASSLTNTVPPVIYAYDSTSGAPPNDMVFDNVSVECGYDTVKLYNTGLVKWFGGSLRDFTHTAMTISGNAATVAGGGNDQYIYGVFSDEDDATYQNQNTLVANIYSDQSGGSITIDGADLLHGHVGILLAPGTGQYVQWLYANQIYADTCDYQGTTATGATTVTTAGPSGNQGETYVTGAAGIGIVPTGNGIVYGIMVSNSWSSTCLNAVKVTGLSTTSISGLNFENLQSLNSGGDIFTVSHATDVNITNPLWAGGSQLAPHTYAGLNLTTGADHVTLTGGRIGGPVEGYGSTMKFGLALQPGFTGTLSASTTDISGNNVAAVYRADGSTTSTFNNLPGYNPVGVTVPVVGASPWTYTNIGSPSTMLLTGGTVSAVSLGGHTICTSTPCSVPLNANQATVVTYTVAPTAYVNTQ